MSPSPELDRIDDALAAMLRRATDRLREAGVAQPQRDARLLARHAFGLDGAGLAASADLRPGDADRAAFEAAVAARAERRPLSHIVGRREFYGRSFKIDGRALDPRPESELLVELGLAAIAERATPTVLDLGVGSGCLLLSVLAERADARGLGVDASAEALALAAENRAELGLENRAALRQGDWFDGVDGSFDLILCNPPYIAAGEIAGLAPEVRRYEPMAALSPGADGLSVYRMLAPNLADRLRPDGAALFEVGRGQASAASEIFAGQGRDAAVVADLGGVDRVVVVRNA